MSNETNATNDFLDYDINESFSHFDWAELAPVLVVYSLTFFLGLIGNVVIIGSTLCPRLRPLPATPTNVFLGGLATADLLLILFCIPVKVAKLFSYTWTMGLFLCKSVHYMQSVSAICSVVTLTAMSIERSLTRTVSFLSPTLEFGEGIRKTKIDETVVQNSKSSLSNFPVSIESTTDVNDRCDMTVLDQVQEDVI
ncbi:Galanin receptor type 1 [Eufriesea mexicana]|uniref:Galanin receptor type 1 n=1 Tax=Eufriesea mexicana TaxID=516756 RepID=A0A310S8Z0_9HYME|nr:Galanin receptor type 1 [Eufriesea mexicana]